MVNAIMAILYRFRFALVFLVCSVLGRAQSTAEVRGRVLDPSHRPVVSALVLLTAQDTSLMRAATTDEVGSFVFPSLPVGTYSIEVKAEGYATFSNQNLRASIGQVLSLNISLGEHPSASSSESATGSLVESENSQLGVVMGEIAVSNLPLKSRDAFDLLQLQPGVQGTLGAGLFFGGDQPGVVSVNGGRARSNNSNVDGGTSGDQMVNNPSIEPSIDSISEFRILSHNYDADSGRNSGSVLNVITKSGSSKLHGTAYEFLRNNALNAKGYFDRETPDFKQNDFGGTLSGPVWRNRTFFFTSYEGWRQIQGISSLPVVVPAVRERAGDFSQGPTFSGVLQSSTVAQALNARAGCAAAVQAGGGSAIAAGTPYASIFPGNVIPPDCFDPTAADLMNQFVPLPNSPQNVFQDSPNARRRDDQITARIDHNLTGQQLLSLYYYGSDEYATDPFARFQDLGASLPGFGDRKRQRFQQLNLTHEWTITAKTVNEARVVYHRQGQGNLLSPSRTNLVQNSCATVPANQCFSDPSNPRLGIDPGYSAEYEGVPFVGLSGGFSIGDNSAGYFSQHGNTYQAQNTLSKIMGSHTLKAGTDWRNQRLNQIYVYDVNGSFSFYGEGANDVGFADLIPNYLLGLPDSYVEGSANGLDVRSAQADFFAQDTWKLKPHVVLTYGLRWDWNTPHADASKRVQTFRPGQATSVYPCLLSPGDPLLASYGSSDCGPMGPARSVFPLGLVVPGDPGVPDGLTRGYLYSFAPRVGLAWSPAWDAKWLSKLSGGPGHFSVRFGWGMFYDSPEELLFGENLAAQPPFGGSTALNNIFFNTPFLGQDGTINPNPFQGFQDPKPGTPIDFASFRPITLYGSMPSRLKSQYSDHYHLTVQRQLGHDTLLQLGYVGTQSHRLLATQDLNYGTAQTCLDLNLIPGMSCGQFQADSSFYIHSNAIPAGGTLHLPYGSTPAVTGPNPNPIMLVGLRRYSSPFCQPTTGDGCPADGVPVFGSIFSTQPVASSSYNSFQALATRHFSRGLEFLASYTWSKSFDNASSFEESVNPLNPRSSRSLSLFDARHRFVLSETWRLPELKGENWAHHLTNGWSLSSIVTLQSGFPIRMTSTEDFELMSSYAYTSSGEPDQIAPLHRLSPQTSGGYFFDPASFADPALGAIGNSRRTICCGPGITNIDLGIHKVIPLREATNLEFRTELFNFFNHTQFFNPDGNISDGTNFGQVSQAHDPRLIQVALRLTF